MNNERPKNWLLIQVRRWHGWAGLIVAPIVVMICLTGLYLNHKDLFARRHDAPAGPGARTGVKAGEAGGPVSDGRSSANHGMHLTTATDLTRLPVGLDTAMSVARRHWGHTPIDKLELKVEQGQLVYKVRAGPERELILDAETGQEVIKKSYKTTSTAAPSLDWPKLLKDLHTGKIGGIVGKLTVDAASLTLLLLTGSGIYLWAVPRWRKRQANAVAAANSGARRESRIAAATEPAPAAAGGSCGDSKALNMQTADVP